MAKKIIFTFLLAYCVTASAQIRDVARRPGPSVPPTGRVEVSLHPWHAVGTMEALVRSSTVILQGTVLTTLPSVQLSPNSPYSVETSSVVAIDHIWKGAFEGSPAVIPVMQTGGTVNGLEVVVPEAPLMKEGEKYVLFLEPALQSKPGTAPQYNITAGWAGLVKIVDGKVLMSPRDTEALKVHDNIELDAFLRVVDDTIHYRNVVLKKTESRADVPWPVQEP